MPPSWEAEQVFIGTYTMSHHVDWRYTKVNVSPRYMTSCTTCDEISQTPFSPAKRLGNQSLINVCIHGKVLRSKVTDQMQLDTPGGYPCSQVPFACWESLGTRLPEGWRQIQFPVLFWSEKGIYHSEFLFVFPLEKEKRSKDCMFCNSLYAFFRKRNPSFWIPFLFLSEKGMFLKKDQRNMRFEFCFSFCLRKEKGNMLPIWFFIPGRSKDVKSAKIHFLENWFLIGRKVLALFIQLKNQFSRKRISADFIVVWPTKKWKINFA